ncbi:hypothetical protein ALC53_13201 [Atta colombica]|uniref:Uncharacterized protein n=1 Tax=Atta colombica TaxID=520822 RepID=A0A151HYP5_9HYME|nr:hypothetical protein ALC53_13201 [Atta colombica]
MGRYLRCSPPANGALEYVDLCASARSETSFYLSFHGMDVKVEETGVPYAPSSLLSLSEYRFVRDRSFYVGCTSSNIEFQNKTGFR